MRQIFVIHGGNTYDSYEHYLEQLQDSSINYERLKPQSSWKLWLRNQLPDYDVLTPSMPNSDNAQYEEWCMIFDKIVPFFSSNDVTLVGHSLGGIFLAKYLTEHPLSHPINRLIIVAAPYDSEEHESLGSFRHSKTPNLAASAKEIHFMHAKDDEVVPFSELTKYRAALPAAYFHVYENGNHFFWPEFPELLEVINKK